MDQFIIAKVFESKGRKNYVLERTGYPDKNSALSAASDLAGDEPETTWIVMPAPVAEIQSFRRVHVGLDTMQTGPAIRTYNIMIGERRRVAAARGRRLDHGRRVRDGAGREKPRLTR